MKQFLYFLTNPGNEPFLKEEMALKYSERFSFSFSKTGICTYRNNGKLLTLQEIKELDITYARSWGQTLLLGNELQIKTQAQEFLSHFEQTIYIAQVSKVNFHPPNWMKENQLTSNNLTSDWKEASAYLIQVATGRDQFLLGIQLVDKYHSPPGRLYNFNPKVDAPSRAYFKIKETFQLMGMESNTAGLVCAELGCAPGGSSAYLLEQGHKVIGIDPAQMHEKIIAHPNFRFINLPMQSVERNQLPTMVDCIISDVNLNPKLVLRYLLGIFGNKTPKQAFITIKTPTPNMIAQKIQWNRLFQELGYSQVQYVQLAAHRKECLAIAF